MAVNATLLSVIAIIGQAVIALLSLITSIYKNATDKNKIKQDKIDASKSKIDKACDKGTLNDLIDATKQLGDSKK